MNTNNAEIIYTNDGSTTLFLPGLNDTYHSKFGAEQESRHVYIKNGLQYLATKNLTNINILEVGYGTGLNIMLSLEAILKPLNLIESLITYTGLEPNPIPSHVYSALRFPGIAIENSQVHLNGIHAAAYDMLYLLADKLPITKHQTTLSEFALSNKGKVYDLIYYDAFGPNKQPEMWDEKAVNNIKVVMGLGCILVTYCAQGAFKRNLKAAGFDIEILKGPPFKKEMIRATLVNI